MTYKSVDAGMIDHVGGWQSGFKSPASSKCLTHHLVSVAMGEISFDHMYSCREGVGMCNAERNFSTYYRQASI